MQATIQFERCVHPCFNFQKSTWDLMFLGMRFFCSLCEANEAVSFCGQVYYQSRNRLGPISAILPFLPDEDCSGPARLQRAAGQPAAPRCVGFPFGNFVSRRLLPAHGQPRSTRARNCEFWQRHRAPKRLTKNGRKSQFFNGQRSTEIYYRKQFEASTLFPLTVDR